jgi:hypothetical protein
VSRGGADASPARRARRRRARRAGQARDVPGAQDARCGAPTALLLPLPMSLPMSLALLLPLPMSLPMSLALLLPLPMSLLYAPLPTPLRAARAAPAALASRPARARGRGG